MPRRGPTGDSPYSPQQGAASQPGLRSLTGRLEHSRRSTDGGVPGSEQVREERPGTSTGRQEAWRAPRRGACRPVLDLPLRDPPRPGLAPPYQTPSDQAPACRLHVTTGHLHRLLVHFQAHRTREAAQGVGLGRGPSQLRTTIRTLLLRRHLAAAPSGATAAELLPEGAGRRQ